MTGSSYPNRISLRGFDAHNVFDAESRIPEGYTLEEIQSGVKILDAETKLEQWEPVNPRSVALRFWLSIGWDDDLRGEDFCVYVITNDLRDRLSLFSSGKTKVLFCHEFYWPKVLQSIHNILDKCERPTMDESWRELRKRFYWEYEGIAGV
ncbi:MAG: Imm8 family immunity protein [Pseudomonadota bacterium]